MFVLLPSPLPGLHSGPISGLDLFRFSTITVQLLTIHCRLHSTANSATLHCELLPNAALSGAVPARCWLRCGPGFEIGSNSFTNQVRTHHRRPHQRLALCRGLLRRRQPARVGPRRPRVACVQALGPWFACSQRRRRGAWFSTGRRVEGILGMLRSACATNSSRILV